MAKDARDRSHSTPNANSTPIYPDFTKAAPYYQQSTTTLSIPRLSNGHIDPLAPYFATKPTEIKYENLLDTKEKEPDPLLKDISLEFPERDKNPVLLHADEGVVRGDPREPPPYTTNNDPRLKNGSVDFENYTVNLQPENIITVMDQQPPTRNNNATTVFSSYN